MNRKIYRCPKCNSFLVPSKQSFSDGFLNTDYRFHCLECDDEIKESEAVISVEETTENMFLLVNLDLTEDEKNPIVLLVDDYLVAFESIDQAVKFISTLAKEFIGDTIVDIRALEYNDYINGCLTNGNIETSLN